jgi:predicted alpha/beta superfamily hydrolase
MKMKYLKIFVAGVLVTLIGFHSQISYGQENEKVSIGEKIKVKSAVLGHDRDILIHLPPEYQQSKATYPVIYVTDAEQSFLLVTSMYEIFPRGGIFPNAIVVGIVNRGEQERYVDFAPVIKDRPESGRAELFMEFFKKELFPYIEQNYRTQPFRILFGHSFLGMFASHIFLTQPDLFNAYIISSPDLRWIKDSISVSNLKKLSKPTFLYISNGTNEKPSQEIKAFADILKSVDNLTYLYVENQGESHQSNGVFSIINGLRFIYSDWSLPKPPRDCTPLEVEEHYKMLSKKYGYEIPNPLQLDK